MSGALRIVAAGRAAVTDLGRFGHAHLGVQINGAADQTAARTANILVGNPDDAPLIEIVLSPFVAVTTESMLIAVTGAIGEATLDGVPLSPRTPVLTWPGAELRLEPADTGVYGYLAVHGRIEGDEFLGSVAVDPLIGRGRHLAAGDVVAVAGPPVGSPPFVPFFRLTAPAPSHPAPRTLDVLPGPEAAQFPGVLERLGELEFTVGRDSDQAGARLEGHAFARDRTDEILSRGVPLGAIEVPPSGGLIALQRGRPITAGYPIIAIVARASHDALAQVRPGDSVRLRPVSRAESLSAAADVGRGLDELRRRAHAMFAACRLFPSPDISVHPSPSPQKVPA